MQIATRLAFNAYVGQLATLNSLDASFTAQPGELKTFNVSPVIEQKLQARLQLTSDFMSRVNVVSVVAQQGDRVGVGVSRRLARRTDTSNGTRRQVGSVHASENIDQYFCKQTNFDFDWRYATLDAWAHKPEFQQLVRDAVMAQKAEDIITIGFNGTSAAANTQPLVNTMLQDVNIGWLQKMRLHAAARVMAHGTKDNLKVYVSDTGNADYVNLDALVFDAIGNLIHERFRTATDLVVIVGSELVQEKYFKIISVAGDKATEQVARDVILSSRNLGGKPTMQVPFFPKDAILITSLKNLSYYWQIGSARRAVKDEPEVDRIANYESINDAFMIEEYGKACLIENIELGPKPAA